MTNRAVAKDDVVLTKYNTIGSVPVAPRTPNDMVDFIHEKSNGCHDDCDDDYGNDARDYDNLTSISSKPVYREY